jgi:hypothetical protein
MIGVFAVGFVPTTSTQRRIAMADQEKQHEGHTTTDEPYFIVEIGRVEALTGHDSHGSQSDGGGTSSRYKDPGRGAGE